MNFDEALEAAIVGEKVRAVDMQPGAYVDYPTPFNGWRINFPSGSSSGYTFKDHDKGVDWEIYEPPVVAWPSLPDIKPREPFKIEPGQGRRGRRRQTVEFTGEAIAWGKPEVKPALNPWADAGLTDEPKPAKSGWDSYE